MVDWTGSSLGCSGKPGTGLAHHSPGFPGGVPSGRSPGLPGGVRAGNSPDLSGGIPAEGSPGPWHNLGLTGGGRIQDAVLDDAGQVVDDTVRLCPLLVLEVFP